MPKSRFRSWTQSHNCIVRCVEPCSATVLPGFNPSTPPALFDCIICCCGSRATAATIYCRGSHVLVGVLACPLGLVHLVLAPGAQVVHIPRLQRQHEPGDSPDGENGVFAIHLENRGIKYFHTECQGTRDRRKGTRVDITST